MLSVAVSCATVGENLNRPLISSIANSGFIERYAMVVPFRPQNVQCARSPHQHPRDVSKYRTGLARSFARFSLEQRKNDSYSSLIGTSMLISSPMASGPV